MISQSVWIVLGAIIVAVAAPVHGADGSRSYVGLCEINPPKGPAENTVKAIVGATLIDGRGGEPIANSVVVVWGNRIVAAGPRESVKVPDNAEVFNATGLTLLPGLIDAHFHMAANPAMFQIPKLSIAHGVTTLRDPGRHMEAYVPIRELDSPVPRCFLTGPHFDEEPPAWPENAIVVKSPADARAAVKRFVDRGASAIKIYFRLPIDSVRATCETAHELNVPVTAHLELLDADQAIEAGLDGIEHITSFGTCLAEPEAAERFRNAVRGDNAAREDGRYQLWAALKLDDSPRVKPLLDLLVRRGVFVSPTLTTFEQRSGDSKTELFHVRGFLNMMKFTGLCHASGATVVVGSHTWGRHTEVGWAFQREMELLVESGLSPAATIQAATWNNARFLGCADRLGSIETGKLADLLLIAGDPIADIRAMYKVKRVMLNGLWTTE